MGYTKYSCFLQFWDSKARNKLYKKEQWPMRLETEAGRHNVINVSLFPTIKIILPSLHINLGLFRQFVKGLDKHSSS